MLDRTWFIINGAPNYFALVSGHYSSNEFAHALLLVLFFIMRPQPTRVRDKTELGIKEKISNDVQFEGSSMPRASQ
jgi:hypothetical protein